VQIEKFPRNFQPLRTKQLHVVQEGQPHCWLTQAVAQRLNHANLLEHTLQVDLPRQLRIDLRLHAA